MTKTLLATAALLVAVSSHAAVSIPAPTAVYANTFDNLASAGASNAWANNSTMSGWSLFNGVGGAIATYAAGTGSGTAGAFYSFGSTAGDRAFGGVGSGGTYFGSPSAGAVAGYIAVAFSNGTGLVLDSFSAGFNGEQWRNGGNATAHTMVMEYGFGASFGAVSGWTAPGGSFNFTGPIATATAAAVDGNVAGLMTGLGGTIATIWAPGDTLWLRWTERNELGSDHGLAIDNFSFSVTAVPEPGSLALLMAGLGVVGFVARRRRG